MKSHTHTHACFGCTRRKELIVKSMRKQLRLREIRLKKMDLPKIIFCTSAKSYLKFYEVVELSHHLSTIDKQISQGIVIP